MSSSEDGRMDISRAKPQNVSRDSSKHAKRSCNNCRQQKLKCDVEQSPFKACTRCRRLQKECKVEGAFKRVEKRDKYAEMQREIADLRRQLHIATQKNANANRLVPEVVEEGPEIESITKSRQLGDTELPGKTVDELFKEYFTNYHPYLPFLDPKANPNQYFEWSPLLGWTIIIVAARRFRHEPPLLPVLSTEYNKLLWPTISEGPQPYHIVKALCLICTWPLPTTSNPSDTTFLLSSMMMSIALQNILDFPVQLQIAKGKITEIGQRDRRLTWAACNIVAQCTSSAYGLPSQTNFDRLLGSNFALLSPYNIPKNLLDQLRIAHLYSTLGKTLYGSVADPSGLPLENERAGIYNHARMLYGNLVSTLGSDIPMNTELMLLAANIHLDSFAFFLPATSSVREAGLLNLYNASCTFISKTMDYETATGTLLEHCTNILTQTLFSAIIALMKLLHSSFSISANIKNGKALFNAGILSVRRMSLRNDDVCARMATRMPQAAQDLGQGWFLGKE